MGGEFIAAARRIARQYLRFNPLLKRIRLRDIAYLLYSNDELVTRFLQ